MPLRPDQYPPPASAQQLFSDRLNESSAMKEALKAVDGRLREDELTTSQPKNVLVFYGIGGVGKSSLSRRLGSC